MKIAERAMRKKIKNAGALPTHAPRAPARNCNPPCENRRRRKETRQETASTLDIWPEYDKHSHMRMRKPESELRVSRKP